MNKYKPQGFQRYAEPFGGMMWFYLRGDFLPEKVYYNDTDPFIVNLFHCFKHYSEFGLAVAQYDTWNQKDFEMAKSILRRTAKNSGPQIRMPDFSVGGAYLYVMIHIFSGFPRMALLPNVKMVERGKKSYPMLESVIFRRLCDPYFQIKLDALSSISQESYEKFIQRIDGTDLFIYADPPYYGRENLYARDIAPSHVEDFSKEYINNNFTKDDHLKLANILKGSKCKWMLSYYDFPELHEWFPEDKYYWMRKKTKIHCGNMNNEDKSFKSDSEEIIIMNYRYKTMYSFLKGGI